MSNEFQMFMRSLVHKLVRLQSLKICPKSVNGELRDGNDARFQKRLHV